MSAVAPQRPLEDPLTYLPRKRMREYSKGQTIYAASEPSPGLCLLVGGLVKISRPFDHGSATAHFITKEHLFGYVGLVAASSADETAVALRPSMVMSWPRYEIESLIESQPQLGLALIQHTGRQCLVWQDRLESHATNKTSARVMIAFLQLCSTLGEIQVDGSTSLPGLTHQTLADYVGTSREIVTFEMNRLRRLGMLVYSRHAISVHVQALRESLIAQGVSKTLIEDR